VIQIVWECVVKQEHRGQFELVFGPGGAWSRLFSDCDGYRGTTVLRDTAEPRRYAVVDVWDTDPLREQALRIRADAYGGLQAQLDAWSESRTDLGTFRVLAQASVRPRGRAGGRPPSRSRTRRV